MHKIESIPYASAVGSIMYTMVCCRPDLAYAMSVINKFMSNPGYAHWEIVKGVLRFIKGTLDHGLSFKFLSLLINHW